MEQVTIGSTDVLPMDYYYFPRRNALTIDNGRAIHQKIENRIFAVHIPISAVIVGSLCLSYLPIVLLCVRNASDKQNPNQ